MLIEINILNGMILYRDLPAEHPGEPTAAHGEVCGGHIWLQTSLSSGHWTKGGIKVREMHELFRSPGQSEIGPSYLGVNNYVIFVSFMHRFCIMWAQYPKLWSLTPPPFNSFCRLLQRPSRNCFSSSQAHTSSSKTSCECSCSPIAASRRQKRSSLLLWTASRALMRSTGWAR